MKPARLIFGTVLAVVMTVGAAAQSAPGAHDPFGYWNASLSNAAEAALTRTMGPVTDALQRETQVAAAGAVRDFAQLYWNGREDNLQQALARVHELRPVIEPILREQQVPTELVAAVLVESAGRSTAISSRGARGVWQLMPDTARRYGLLVSDARDERLDVVKSSRAAARYLYDLHAQFGSWRLALAAYNAGEGTVQHAREQAGAVDFPRLSGLLPGETSSHRALVITPLSTLGSAALHYLQLRPPPAAPRFGQPNPL